MTELTPEAEERAVADFLKLLILTHPATRFATLPPGGVQTLRVSPALLAAMTDNAELAGEIDVTLNAQGATMAVRAYRPAPDGDGVPVPVEEPAIDQLDRDVATIRPDRITAHPVTRERIPNPGMSISGQGIRVSESGTIQWADSVIANGVIRDRPGRGSGVLCEATQPEGPRLTCTQPRGHEGSHQARDNARQMLYAWPNVRPNGARPAGPAHPVNVAMDLYDRGMGSALCRAAHPSGEGYCTRAAGHERRHEDGTGRRWLVTACTGLTLGGQRCTLTAGHPGAHGRRVDADGHVVTVVPEDLDG